MKIIRYILSHGLLLGFLVVLGFTYYYRTQLFSDSINQRIDGSVAAVVATAKDVAEVFGYKKQQQADTSSEPAEVSEPDMQAPQSSSVTENQEVVVTENTSMDTTTNTTDEQAETAMQVTDSDNTVEPAQTGGDTQQDESALAQAVTDETTTAMVTQASETDSPVESDMQAEASTQAQMIIQARQAFHSGDINRSISLYQELGELDPANPDVFGELGNVYYSQGKWKQAGEAYYEAASLLLDQGQARQVNYLFRVIQGLDQESARKLEQKLTQ